MHLRGGRGNVPRPHNQHERNQGMSRQSRGGDKATVTKNTEGERAFQDMIQCIAELPMVTTPKPKEELIIYLCANKEAISTVLLREREFEFEASKNKAGYESLIAGLRIAEQMGVQNLSAKVDSRLLANQINGSYIAKEEIILEVLKEKSIEEKEILVIVEEEGYSGMTPLIKYLLDGTLSADTKEARAIQIKARQPTSGGICDKGYP
ncbi:reverse transcriptase domain-containing protein [Tanacetum coccineum]